MVVSGLVEGIACLPIMGGFEGVHPRGDVVGLVEGVSHNRLCSEIWYNTQRYE